MQIFFPKNIQKIYSSTVFSRYQTLLNFRRLKIPAICLLDPKTWFSPFSKEIRFHRIKQALQILVELLLLVRSEQISESHGALYIYGYIVFV